MVVGIVAVLKAGGDGIGAMGSGRRALQCERGPLLRLRSSEDPNREKEASGASPGRWSSSHHPFTAPMAEDVAKLYSGEYEAVGL